MDSAHWPQVVVKSMEEEEGSRRAAHAVLERKAKAGKDQILNCPRCNSNNTKFCYYNNYSLSQPRYFCKSCRRYWTAGGSLRNIPVGGASRKNKRPSSANFSSPNNNIYNNNNSINNNDEGNNPIIINTNYNPSSSNSNSNTTTTTTTSSCNWLSSSDHMNQMLRISSGMSQRELIPFMPMSAAAAAAAASQSTTTTTTTTTNSARNMLSNNNGITFEGEEAGEAARRLFSSNTVEDFKQLPVPTIISSTDQNGGKLGDVPAFWNGIFGGGSW